MTIPNDPRPSTPGAPAFDPYARPALPNIPPPDDAGGAARAMWCTDCRVPLRTYYFAMNTRPVCSKCKTGYEEQIARGTGSAAFVRAALWGGAAALAGAAVLAGMLLTIGAVGRILMAVGIGWSVGTAIKKANGGYPGIQYQILAGVLTYFAIGLASLAPVVRDIGKARADWVADSTRGARDDSARAVLAASQGREAGAASEPASDPGRDVIARVDSVTNAPKYARRRLVSGSNASELGTGNIVSRIVASILLIFTLPLLSLFAFGGIYGAAITLGAIGFGVYKAWDLTSGGPVLELSGPHKVGAGPIAPVF